MRHADWHASPLRMRVRVDSQGAICTVVRCFDFLRSLFSGCIVLFSAVCGIYLSYANNQLLADYFCLDFAPIFDTVIMSGSGSGKSGGCW